jgi:carboxylesterase type B
MKVAPVAAFVFSVSAERTLWSRKDGHVNVLRSLNLRLVLVGFLHLEEAENHTLFCNSCQLADVVLVKKMLW